MSKAYILFTSIVLLLIPTFLMAADDSLLTSPSVNIAEFKVYRTDSPTVMEKHKLTIENSGGPIPNDNRVSFRLDSTPVSIICNGTTQNLPGGLPGKNNSISCSVDRSGNFFSGTAVDVSVSFHNPNTYSNTSSDEPGMTDLNLSETSAAHPYCNTETSIQACKWQQKNTNDTDLNSRGVPLNKWVVFATTTFSAKLGYPVDTSYFRTGEIYCNKDVNNNGSVEKEELFGCITGTPQYLCPVDAIKCDPPLPAGCANKDSGIATDVDLCLTAVSCPGFGGYSPSEGACIDGAFEDCNKAKPPVCTWKCNAGYSLRSKFVVDHIEYYCVASPYCHIGSMYNYNGSLQCLTGTPICPEGGIYNTRDNVCYPTGFPCPYGEKYPCINANGYPKPMCSPYFCATVQQDGAAQGASDKNNNGTIDSSGKCLGQLYIFSGKDRRCRSGGINISYENCCKDSDYFLGLFQCNAEEADLAQKKKKDLCVYVGSYCSRRISFPFGASICLETKKSYCCFQTKLARMVQEQGRPQLKTFNAAQPFGSPSNPQCKGFTPDEFQSLNFSKMDLSEWYADIETNSQTEVKDTMTNRVNNFFGH